MRKVANPDDYRDRFGRVEDFDCLKWAWETIPEVRSFGGFAPWVQSMRGERRYRHKTEAAREIARRHGIQITFDHKGMASFTRPGRQP